MRGKVRPLIAASAGARENPAKPAIFLSRDHHTGRTPDGTVPWPPAQIHRFLTHRVVDKRSALCCQYISTEVRAGR